MFPRLSRLLSSMRSTDARNNTVQDLHEAKAADNDTVDAMHEVIKEVPEYDSDQSAINTPTSSTSSTPSMHCTPLPTVQQPLLVNRDCHCRATSNNIRSNASAFSGLSAATSSSSSSSSSTTLVSSEDINELNHNNTTVTPSHYDPASSASQHPTSHINASSLPRTSASAFGPASTAANSTVCTHIPLPFGTREAEASVTISSSPPSSLQLNMASASANPEGRSVHFANTSAVRQTNGIKPPPTCHHPYCLFPLLSASSNSRLEQGQAQPQPATEPATPPPGGPPPTPPTGAGATPDEEPEEPDENDSEPHAVSSPIPLIRQIDQTMPQFAPPVGARAAAAMAAANNNPAIIIIGG